MDLCPTEIWQNVFKFACLDSGLTGRSLSLVSKYFNQASKPFIFQSIYLKNIDQIVAFAAILDRTYFNLQPVRHLYISTYNQELEEEASDIKKMKEEIHTGVRYIPEPLDEDWDRRRKELASKFSSRRRRVEKMEAAFSQAIPLIFRSIAPCLKTLHMLLPNLGSIFDVLVTPLLQLEELTVLGQSFDCTQSLRLHLTFPNLRYVHLHPLNPTDAQHREIFECVTDLPPSISHLRVSGVSIDSVDHHANCEPRPTQSVIIESLSNPKANSKWIPQHFGQYHSLDHAITHITERRDDVRVISLAEVDGTSNMVSLALQTEQQWLDRIGGGRGCWV